MTHEILPAIDGGLGAQVVQIGRQATKATDPTLGTTDAKYLRAWSCDVDLTNVPRRGVSPGAPGFKPTKSTSQIPFSGEAEVKCPTIASADSTDRPEIDPILYAAQWRLTSDATDKTHTYVLSRSGSQISAFYDTVYDEDDSDGVKITGLDAQMMARLMWEAGDDPRLIVAFEGTAAGFQTTGDWSDVLADTGAGSIAATYATEDPALALGATIKLVDLRDNSLFGGGSLASPSNLLMMRSFEFNPGQAVNTQKGAQPLGGLGRIRSIQNEAATISVVVEATVLADFNPRDWELDMAPVEVNCVFSSPSATGNTVQFLAYGFVTKVQGPVGQEADGARLYQIDIQVGYPEDSDGSPAVGISPNQEFKAGTNQGLGLQPTATLSKGVACLQFATA